MSDNAGGVARKHHYVPQCYLKHFTHDRSKKSQLYVVDAPRRRAFWTTPSNIAAERDFNRIDGEDPNAIEAMYADFEAKLAPVLVRADTRRGQVDEADLAILLEMVALFAVRSPRRREHLRQFYEHSTRMIMDQALATRERWESQVRRAVADGFMAPPKVSYEDMKAFVDSGEYRIDVTTTRHVATELELLPVVYNLLHERRWAVLRASAESGGFVTSDNPTTLCWDDATLEGGFYPPGFGATGTSVVSPLSKTLAIRGSFDGRDGVLEVPPDLVAAINTRTIALADRQIYAQNDRFEFVGPDNKVNRGDALLSRLTAVLRTAAPAGEPS